MNIDPAAALYYIFMLAYLGLFGVIILTLRKMAQALNRIADKLDAPPQDPGL